MFGRTNVELDAQQMILIPLLLLLQMPASDFPNAKFIHCLTDMYKGINTKNEVL